MPASLESWHDEDTHKPPITGVTIMYKYVVERWERQRSRKTGRTGDSGVVGNSLI